MASWLHRNTGETEPKNDETFEVQLKPHLDTLKTEISQNVNDAIANGINENPVLKNMQKFLELQEREREEALAAIEARKQQQQTVEFDPNDPKQYVDNQLGRLAQEQLATNARLIRREIFEDAESYPYYTGELKKKIDDMIDAEPPANRANPLLIKNVYKLCAFDAMKDIEEGKIKSRLSSASATSTTNGTTSNINPDAPLTAEEKFYIKKMGIDEKSYVESKKEIAAMEGSLV